MNRFDWLRVALSWALSFVRVRPREEPSSNVGSEQSALTRPPKKGKKSSRRFT